MPKREYYFAGKAISVQEPWASTIAFAGKDIENRPRYTYYRGPIAIHASQKVWWDDLDLLTRQVRGGEKRTLREWIIKGLKRYYVNLEDDILSPGRIIAIGMLVDCVDQSSSPWFRGKWGLVIESLIPIDPIEKKGNLGLWDCEFSYELL